MLGFDSVIECRRMFGVPDYLLRVAVADPVGLRGVLHEPARRAAGDHAPQLAVHDEGRQARRARADRRAERRPSPSAILRAWRAARGRVVIEARPEAFGLAPALDGRDRRRHAARLRLRGRHVRRRGHPHRRHPGRRRADRAPAARRAPGRPDGRVPDHAVRARPLGRRRAGRAEPPQARAAARRRAERGAGRPRRPHARSPAPGAPRSCRRWRPRTATSSSPSTATAASTRRALDAVPARARDRHARLHGLHDVACASSRRCATPSTATTAACCSRTASPSRSAATWPATNHEASLLVVERLFGWVGDSAALVSARSTGSAPARARALNEPQEEPRWPSTSSPPTALRAARGRAHAVRPLRRRLGRREHLVGRGRRHAPAGRRVALRLGAGRARRAGRPLRPRRPARAARHDAARVRRARRHLARQLVLPGAPRSSCTSSRARTGTAS